MNSLKTTTLRELTIDELEIVSGGKKPKIVGVVVERCESHYKGDKKISVCTSAN
jgi:hypothetical protein